MSDLKILKWEKIDDGMHRSRTPTGWLVRECVEVCHINSGNQEYITSGYDWRTSITFVPDPDEVWLK